MKNILALLIVFLVVSCNSNPKPSLLFLNKNAYEYPVWKEMLLQERIKFPEVIKAFKAYESTHNLDEETVEHFKKLQKRITPNLDEKGFYISELRRYKNLMKYRNATPTSKKIVSGNTSYPTSYKFDIPNSKNFGSWKNIGPFGNPDVQWSATGNGAVQYIEMHPTNPAIMYAATRNGGLWKTINYGKNWVPQTDHFATNNTSCITVSRANPSVLYLGTAADQLIWYSSDGGATWLNRSNGITGTIYDIHSDPTDATRAIAATTHGIFLTIDAGINWTKKISGSYTDIDLTDNWDLIVVSSDEDNIKPVFHFSKDKGTTFIEQTIISHLAKVDKFYLGLHKPKTGPTELFAYGLVISNKPTRFIGLWKSDYTPNPLNGASHFNFVQVKHPTYTYPNGPVQLTYDYNGTTNATFAEEKSDYYGSINPYAQSTWISDFYISPNNPKRMLTLREKFWGSEDGGIIWSTKPSYGESNWADNRYITTNIAKDSVFWCNDGGMWAMKETDLFPTDAQVTASGLSRNAYQNSKVVQKNGDICVPEGSQMDVSQMNKGVFMTGGQDIGQIFTRNGRSSHVASADVYRGRIKPSDDTKFITGSLAVKLPGSTTTFSVYDNIEPDHFNSNRLYGFTKSPSDIRLVRSPAGNDGWLINNFMDENIANKGGGTSTPIHDNWEIVSVASAGITSLKAGTFEQSKAAPELAFLGDEVGNRLFYTDNLSIANPTWVELKNAPKASRYRITTHQYNKNMLVIATNLGVYISKDKGQTWNRRANFPKELAISVLLDKNTSEGIYVLTSLAVYYIDEHLDTWIEFNKGLPLQNNSDMRIAYYPNNDNRLFVSKYGRGVWFSSLHSVLNNSGNRPIADFSIRGNDSRDVNIGETVSLFDQSSNATNLQWTIENGTNIIKISDEKEPKVKLSKAGNYKVTLVAKNTNGTNTKVKEYYLTARNLSTPKCQVTATVDNVWFKGYKNFKINSDTYLVAAKKNYIDLFKRFNITSGEKNQISLEVSYSRNNTYGLHSKVWIDYNNDGDFDDTNEEILNSNTRLDKFNSNFTPPSTAVLNKPLLMRVVGVESTSAPTSCPAVATVQTLDFQVIINSKILFSSTHNSVSENSANLQTTFSGASNILQAGFVYSKFDGALTTENSNIKIYNSPLSTNDTFSTSINNLEYNTSYYYRPFVRDQSNIYYGDKKSFKLTSYKIPMSENLISLNLGNNKWMLKGTVFPENNTLSSLSIEYGITDFSNNVVFNPSLYSTTTNINISTDITTVLGKSYQVRIKFVASGKTYYSRIYKFTTNQKICNPTIGNKPWWRRISNVTFNGNSNDSTGGDSGYTDFTNIIYTVDKGKTYPISIKNSLSGQTLEHLIYIDYNNDGDFDDPQETVIQAKSASDIFTTTITIPTNNIVYDKNLRMRIIGYVTNATSCTIETGEVEDYAIKITSSSLTTEGFNSLFMASLYPNPTATNLYVNIKKTLIAGDYSVQIFDINGKKVYSKKLTSLISDFKIDIRNFSLGIYVLKLSNNKGSRSIKFIKSAK